MSRTLVDRDPGILGEMPVFCRMRVPIRMLMEVLEAGDRLENFLRNHPTVTRNHAIGLLKRARTGHHGGGDEPTDRRIGPATARTVLAGFLETCPAQEIGIASRSLGTKPRHTTYPSAFWGPAVPS